MMDFLYNIKAPNTTNTTNNGKKDDED